MRLLAMAVLALGMCVVAGCGGMPQPRIEAMTPRAGTTNVRVVLTATNYDESWDKENLRLRCKQIWLNDDEVPVKDQVVFERPFNGRQGDTRFSVLMKDNEGQETNRVRLEFSLVSGENEVNTNVSASATLEWKVPSGLLGKDLLLLGVISRKTRNSYAVDVLYALEPATGEMVQVLPSYDAK